MQDKTTSTAPAATTTLDSDAAAAPQALAATAVAAGCQIYPPTTFQVCGAIRDKYNQMGGPTSFLLLPKSNELTNPGNTGKRSEFIGGNIYWSAATGAHPVAHEFLFKWGDHGYERGFLKYPTTDEIVLAVDGISRRQQFQGGHIYWSPATGAHSIQGLIYDKWKAFGAETGVLKFPTSDEIVAPDGKGRFTNFQGGAIYWHPTTGAHPVYGPLHVFWGLSGYEAGPYGYPTGDPVYTGDNVSQQFQRGTLRLWDGYFEGIRPVDDSEVITYADTNIHPEYNVEMDYARYGITPDPDGHKAENNREGAQAVGAYFQNEGRPTALVLWRRFYSNMGLSYGLSTETLDRWNEAEHTAYLDANGKPLMAPAPIRAANRDRAVAQAIAQADKLNKRVKVIVSDPFWVQTGAGSDDNDHVQSLGVYSMTAATAVIASPGPVGQHPIQLAQQAHMQDGYDFKRDNPGADPMADAAAELAVDAFELGIAKWFFVYGEGSQTFWEGLR